MSNKVLEISYGIGKTLSRFKELKKYYKVIGMEIRENAIDKDKH